jgi:hypothetical protein
MRPSHAEAALELFDAMTARRIVEDVLGTRAYFDGERRAHEGIRTKIEGLDEVHDDDDYRSVAD